MGIFDKDRFPHRSVSDYFWNEIKGFAAQYFGKNSGDFGFDVDLFAAPGGPVR